MTTDDALLADPSVPDPVSATVDEVARSHGVDPARGLSADEARSRLATHGPNLLTSSAKEPG
jgi:Ca2+-transporting ATPase